MMRIITGKARGIKLNTLKGNDTRPTTERAKEAVFSMLQFDIADKKILDVFAGSGQMGLEALSRGAFNAVFVDNSKEAVEIIKSNISKTHMGESSLVICSDVVDYLKSVGKRKKFDIVFMDPPYNKELLIEPLYALINGDLISDDAIVICESEKEDIFSGDTKLKSKFEVLKQAKYGISFITIIKPTGEI